MGRIWAAIWAIYGHPTWGRVHMSAGATWPHMGYPYGYYMGPIWARYGKAHVGPAWSLYGYIIWVLYVFFFFFCVCVLKCAVVTFWFPNFHYLLSSFMLFYSLNLHLIVAVLYRTVSPASVSFSTFYGTF